MPIIVIACREALAAVPHSIKQAALALGASPMQTAFHHTLPMAIPGILSGVILAISRIIGETAPLLIVGAAGYISFAPESPFDEFSALPVQIYNWAARPQEEFHHLAAAGIVVLLGVVFSFNLIAIIIRNRSLNRKRS
jgi:phosphate transport system permease protein